MEKDVDFTCSEYDKYIDAWTKCRIVAEGSEVVKEAGTEFLPALTDQRGEEYEKYKNRALFFEGTTRTVNGLLGMLFAKDPSIICSDEECSLEKFIPLINSPKEFLKEVCRETVTVGRTGLLVDVNSAGEPYITKYLAEDIINWRTSEFSSGEELELVVLKELALELENPFKTKEVCRYRVLFLDQNKVYTQKLFQKSEKGDDFMQIGEDIVPTKNGAKLDKIPFFFIGSTGNSPTPYRPPLIGLVNVNISHYMNSADLEHGRHFTGLPTPWVAGFTPGDNQKLSIGSQVAWVSNKENAKAGFLEFTGQGLTSLENALKEKQDMMIVLGARLLEAPKKASESADNQTSRKQGENSILANIADSVSNGVTNAYKFAVEWKGKDAKDVKIEIHKDFSNLSPDPQLLSSMMAAVQGGLMSFDTWFYNLQSRGVIPEGVTVEDEDEKIQSRKSEFVDLQPGGPEFQKPKK